MNDILDWIVSTIWLSGLAYNSLSYQSSKNLIDDEIIDSSSQSKGNSNIEELDQSAIGMNELLANIIEKLTQEKLFLNPHLTITDLAQKVDLHTKLVSKIINSQMGQNFNSFINLYRVKYAKMLLVDPKNQQISIEGIGKMSGFRSNGVFHSSFKKELNLHHFNIKKTLKLILISDFSSCSSLIFLFFIQ